MAKKPAVARISITLPPDVLAAADRQAQALRRPRSWVIAEAIRRYPPVPAEAPPTLHGTAEVAAARHQHLLASLRLAPEKRLRRAAQMVRMAPRTGRARRTQIIGFGSYEDFYAWKKARRAEGLPPS